MGDVKCELQKTRAPVMPKNENKDLPKKPTLSPAARGYRVSIKKCAAVFA